MKKWIRVLGIAAVAIASTALPILAEEASEPAAAVQSPAAGAGDCGPSRHRGDETADAVPEPVLLGGPCMFCQSSPASFNHRFGEICTYAGDCEKGPDPCCYYTCGCGVGNGGDPVPEAACLPLDDPGCCANGRGLCQVSYCESEGVRCIANGCGVGCCLYGCQPDESCTAPDPVPSTAC